MSVEFPSDEGQRITSHPNRPYEGFEGTIGGVVATSSPDWQERPSPPAGAPNVILMLADDLGFADLSCYGSEIATPHLDGVAGRGLRFTNFHVNPMCSPTRASMLTGLNSHLAGIGHVCHSDPGFPGYAMEMTDRAATLAELYRDNGWNTMMVGKWHLTKDQHLSESAPKHSWPCQKGFERFYGILDGFTNFHHPHRLYEDNHAVDVERYPEGYYFTDDITDRATRMIREAKASDPTKPFFLYYSHGAVHAPLQAKPEDIERHRGAYDAGWDEVRVQRYERQIELGVIPASTPLPPRNSEEANEVPAWDDLSADEKVLFARYMEVFAGMVDTVDQSVGALFAELERLGELDNTIFIFTSDNGGSREGEAQGTSSYFDVLRLAAGMAEYEQLDYDVSRLEQIGGPQTLPHYPRGWAMVSNTPFRMYKINTHAGGHQVPFLVQWPKADLSGGELRSQYQHVTDLMPTLLELSGLERPDTHAGAPALPLAGVSFAEALQDGAAASTHHEQYYEMIGHRGFYRDGWEAVTLHQPRTPFGDHEWELYHTAVDPSQVNDLAEAEPEKLAELIDGFTDAAWANQVYPLDEGTGLKMIQRSAAEERFAEPVTLYPNTPTIERYRSLALISMRAFTVTVNLDGYEPGDAGYLFAHGDQGGGYGLRVHNDELVFSFNAYGPMHHLSGGQLAAGTNEIVLEMACPSRTQWDARLQVDGEERGTLDDLKVLFGMAPFQGIDVGVDSKSPVDWEYFTQHGTGRYSGAITSVRYEPGDRPPDHGSNFTDFLRDMGAKFE